MSEFKVGDKVRIKPDCNNTGEPNKTIWTIDKLNSEYSPEYEICCNPDDVIRTWGVNKEDLIPVIEEEQSPTWEYGVKYKTREGKWAIYLGDRRELENSNATYRLIFLHSDTGLATHAINGSISIMSNKRDVTTEIYKELMPAFMKEVWVDLTENGRSSQPEFLADFLFDKSLSAAVASEYKKPGYQKFKIIVEEIAGEE
jgi:hypothetical protein